MNQGCPLHPSPLLPFIQHSPHPHPFRVRSLSRAFSAIPFASEHVLRVRCEGPRAWSPFGGSATEVLTLALAKEVSVEARKGGIKGCVMYDPTDVRIYHSHPSLPPNPSSSAQPCASSPLYLTVSLSGRARAATRRTAFHLGLPPFRGRVFLCTPDVARVLSDPPLLVYARATDPARRSFFVLTVLFGIVPTCGISMPLFCRLQRLIVRGF